MLKLGRVLNTLKMKFENKASTAVFGGVAGLISAGTMAAKATPKFEKDWAEAKENQRKYKHYVAVAKANHGAKIGTFAIPVPKTATTSAAMKSPSKSSSTHSATKMALFSAPKVTAFCSTSAATHFTLKRS